MTLVAEAVQPGRRAGAINLVAALIVVASVLAMALRAASSQPPAIAEFAPQAQQVNQAPNEQTSSFGAGSGAANGLPISSPSPLPLPGNTAGVVLQCVGDPPRQIEDAQSPPCVPTWSGDNGGATSKGVTRSQISIVYPAGTLSAQFQAFFNKRFEFYGRSINLLPAPSYNGNKETDDAAAETAEADAVDEQDHAFASTSDTLFGGQHYRQELARRRIVSSEQQMYSSEAELSSFAPYMWQYDMGTDNAFRVLGDWACSRLVPGDAVHAGPLLTNTPRTFGIVTSELGMEGPLDVSPLQNGLARCGAQAKEVIDLGNWSQNQGQSADEATAIARLKTANVTTVFCFCYALEQPTLFNQAESQAYFPEWINDNFGLQAITWSSQSLPRAESQHLFGLTFEPRSLTYADDPAIQAAASIDPSSTSLSANPSNNDSLTRDQNIDGPYHELLQLASGIQMAGPDLTPQTFSDALQRTAFPNPDTSRYEGHVGFFGGTHTMTIDAAEWWWSNSARSYYNDQPGEFCYVDGGVRHGLGSFPKGGDPFFGGQCQ